MQYGWNKHLYGIFRVYLGFCMTYLKQKRVLIPDSFVAYPVMPVELG